MRKRALIPAAVVALLTILLSWRVGVVRGIAATRTPTPTGSLLYDARIRANGDQMLEEGRRTFRFDTFGDEVYWSDGLGLDRAIAGEKNGGVGAGVSPKAGLALGLKVDMDALPATLVDQIKANKVDLNDPATTIALIKLNAVLGVVGTFDAAGKMTKVGLTCAVCHSTVDDAFSAGIGHRLDGFGNRDLNVGAITAAAPNVSLVATTLGVDLATAKRVLASWGPGRFDAILGMDGKGLRPDGKQAGTIIPNAFGLAGVNNHTWGGGWGDVTYWNAFVANTDLHGRGTFHDVRLSDKTKYPVSARTGSWNLRNRPDLITSKLGALQFYQLSIPAPPPPPGSFDVDAARRGEALFTGKARCASCHVPPLFTEPGWNTHKASEIGIDAFQANRTSGSHHDGRFKDLNEVVAHYDSFLKLSLTPEQKRDLIQYLKSL